MEQQQQQQQQLDRTASPGIRTSVITLESPCNSDEREAKRRCSSIGEESDVRESTSQETERLVPVDHREYSRRSKAASLPDDPQSKFKQRVSEMNEKVEEVELQVSEVLKMRRASMKDKPVGITVTEDDKEKAIAAIKKQRSLENSRREAAHAKRAAELMRIFNNVLRQITQHKWAWPFMQPVDVEGLRLHDYYDIIKKPMDFGTIREKMDAKDEEGYRSVQEAADDVRLVFTNAMIYNEAGADVHVMAKTLSEKFEEKWKAVLEPKVQEEDAKRKQELMYIEVHDGEEAKAAEEVALDRMAHEICRKLNSLEDTLEELKLLATSKCRPMSIEEKRQLGMNLAKLQPAGLNRVIQIIAKNNPAFNPSVVEVEVDIDALDTGTLWQLQCYVQMMLSHQKQSEGADQTPAAAVVVKRRPPGVAKAQK